MTNTYEKIRGEVVAGGALDQEETAGGPKAALGLLAILALLVALLIASPWAFVFVVGLLISIFLHECGHYITARKSGMKVTQFFMGMGPKVWSFRRGEIEYGVRALPVGAFVRIVGMNNLDDIGDDEDESRTYRSKSYPRKLITITAGSIMHMIIAVVLLFTVYAAWGKSESSHKVTIGAVVDNGGAKAAGVQPNDILVSVDGQVVSSSEQVGQLIQAHQPGDHVTLVVQRGTAQQTLTAALGSNPDKTGGHFGTAYLGIQSGVKYAFVHQSFVETVTSSFTDLGSQAWQSVGGVVKVMNPVNIYEHLTGANTDQTTQPVTLYGVSRFSSTVGSAIGFAGILSMLAGVNVFVGLLNLVPLLPFDGGHAAVATYERIRSRKGKRYTADVGKMVPVAMAVMTFLVFVLFAGLYLDITNPIR